MSRLIAGAKFLLGLQPPGRNLDVFPDDVFLVSYPKSGNTWTRFLIGNLISLHERADFSSINRIIPDPEALTKRSANALPRPRILKSHQYFDPRYPKVVYIVRDPRDVAVSQYHFQRKRRVIEDGSPIEDFVRGFITGQSSIYGSWGENAASWLAARNGRPNFLLMRYEDMLEDTHSELAKIASFSRRECVRRTPAQGGRKFIRRSDAETRKISGASVVLHQGHSPRCSFCADRDGVGLEIGTPGRIGCGNRIRMGHTHALPPV